ncbi:MAG: HD domain-containing protein [Oscillospiraceae bacterium]|nr:HD domain-containing protein [Oscillospiraceae bacterium]
MRPDEATGNGPARSSEHCSPWADEATGSRQQATGNRQQATGQGTGNRESGTENRKSGEQLLTILNSQCSILNSQVPAPAREALSRLEAAGYAACLVGGCVRDSLLGRVPGDWDITSSALPEQTEAVFAGERIIETGLKHGTVTVLLDGLPLEITTFRRESGYADHRHPDAVAFTPSLEEDLSRRDFTVNAMAWSPARGLTDPFGGRADLEKGIIRCVGDPKQRFNEDALRILRALRFAAQLDFAIDPATAAAALALRQSLALVSRERIAEELSKLLCGPAVRRIVTEYWPILAQPLPELAPMAGLDQRSPYHCYDVLEHSAAAAEAVPPDRILRWAALLHDAGKPACFTLDEQGRGHFYGHAKPGAELARAALTRLRFDKDTVRRVVQLVELHDYPIDPPAEPVGGGVLDAPDPPEADTCGASRTPPPTKISAADRAIKKLLGRLGEEDFFRLLALKRADALAHHPDYRGRAAACDRFEARARELLAQKAPFSLKDLAVNGNDLLELGFPRGPELGAALKALLEAVLEGSLPNEKAALLEAAGKILAENTDV